MDPPDEQTGIVYALRARSAHHADSELRDPSVTGHIVGLTGNGIDDFRLSGPRQHRGVAAMGECSVIPPTPDANPIAMPVDSQTRSNHYIGFCQRHGPEARGRRLQNAAPRRAHVLPACKSRPIGAAAKYRHAHLPPSSDEHIDERGGIWFVVNAHVGGQHPWCVGEPTKKVIETLLVFDT